MPSYHSKNPNYNVSAGKPKPAQNRSHSETNRYKSFDKNFSIEKYKNQPTLLNKIKNLINAKGQNVTGQLREAVRNAYPKDAHTLATEQKKITSLRNVPVSNATMKNNYAKKRFSLYGDMNFSNTYNMSVV